MGLVISERKSTLGNLDYIAIERQVFYVIKSCGQSTITKKEASRGTAIA